MLHILSFTTLFPNNAQHNHGIFVRNRLQHLKQSGKVRVNVIAPVPWFPSQKKIWGRYAIYAAVEKEEQWEDSLICHPRYLAIPKIGILLNPFTLYHCAKAALRDYIAKHGRPDILDAHYFYPDGVVASWLGKKFGIPVAITGRGSDLELIPSICSPAGYMIVKAAKQAAAIITVSNSLKQSLLQMDTDLKITVLRNGVDLKTFHPLLQSQARDRLDLPQDAKIILSVGHLTMRKGQDILIKALSMMPSNYHLVLVGEGEQKQNWHRLAEQIKVAERVHFIGSRPHSELKIFYSAADVMALATASEGWPNVVLESMACGTPVVATHVSGIPEIITNNNVGETVAKRTPEAFGEAIQRIIAARLSSQDVRNYAEQFSWDATTQGQLQLFKSMAA